MSGLMRQDLYAELYHVENSHWWHQHKRTIVKQLISRMKPGKALDIGCGTGKIIEELNQAGWQCVGVDKSALAQKEGLKRGLKISIADAGKKLPFPDKCFRLVLALDFLEHVKNDQKVVREIKRVLKPSGMIIASVPAYSTLYSYWDKMLGHFRRYSKSDLIQLMKANNLEINFISYYFSWLLLPAVIIRKIKELLKIKTVSDFQTNTNNKPVIYLIKFLSRVELKLLKYIKLPFGLSLICAATPKSSQS